MMQEMAAGQFKAQCLKLMNQVQLESECTRSIMGFLKGTVQVTGDIVSPLDESWEADS